MTGQWWNDDAELLATLAEAVRAERAVPPAFVEAGKAAYTWRTIDAELAALVYDSASEPVLTRAEVASLRALTFASAGLTIELEITDGGLLGQLVPPGRGEVEVQTAVGTAARVSADDVGFFAIRPVPTGRFRLRCHGHDHADEVVTTWVTL